MKLLIITTVKTYEKQAVALFKKANIPAFSHADIKGFKTPEQQDLTDNWFSSSVDHVRSVLFFSFSESHKIDVMLKELEDLNRELTSDNPLRAIVLPIEKII